MTRPAPIRLALLALSVAATTASAAPRSGALVTEAPLIRGSLPLTVTGFGTVRADPTRMRVVAAPTAVDIAGLYVRQGQRVAAGAPLLRLSPDPQTAAAYGRARAALTAAAALVGHTRRLVRSHLATNQQLIEAERRRADAAAALRALLRQGAGGIRTLTAPTAGTVSGVTAAVGAHVGLGAPLLTLAPEAGLILTVGLVPDRAARVKPGDRASVRPAGGGRAVAGTVTFRGAMADGDGLVPVAITPAGGGLMAGETATATIVTGTAHGYVVPHSAILIGDDGHPYVVQAAGGTAKRVPVRVLAADDGRNVVSGALDPAAPLVLSGNYQLGDGMPVRLAPAPRGSKQ
jgi:RND family efflux transporter MFP subunit